jgi:hypothetical protein
MGTMIRHLLRTVSFYGFNDNGIKVNKPAMRKWTKAINKGLRSRLF